MIVQLSVCALGNIHEDTRRLVEHVDGTGASMLGGLHRGCAQEEQLGLGQVIC